MHADSYQTMESLLARWKEPRAKVLDVGSFNVNGTFRPLVEGRGWQYLGLDVRPGPNVDIVSEDPHRYPFADGEFDIIISGSTLEHVERPWLWMPEVARLLCPDGYLVVYTHCSWQYHPSPKDYWRFFPESLELLFDLTGCLRDYEIRMVNGGKDIYGTAFKCDSSTATLTPTATRRVKIWV